MDNAYTSCARIYPKPLRVTLWLSPVILLLLGSLDHFLYEWTGCPFISTFSPVGESLWEHLKIAFYPTIALWTIVYFVFRPTLSEISGAWFLGAVCAAVASAFFVVLTQFFFIETFGLPNEIYVHIPDFFIALCASQALSVYTASHADENRAVIILSALAVIVTITAILVVASA